MLPLSTDLVFAPTLAHWNSACALPSRPSQPDVAILRRCGLPLGYAMIVARKPRGLRGSFRPHLPWTEVEKPATTDSKEAPLSVSEHEKSRKPRRRICGKPTSVHDEARNAARDAAQRGVHGESGMHGRLGAQGLERARDVTRGSLRRATAHGAQSRAEIRASRGTCRTRATARGARSRGTRCAAARSA